MHKIRKQENCHISSYKRGTAKASQNQTPDIISDECFGEKRRMRNAKEACTYRGSTSTYRPGQQTRVWNAGTGRPHETTLSNPAATKTPNPSIVSRRNPHPPPMASWRTHGILAAAMCPTPSCGNKLKTLHVLPTD